MMRNSLKKYSKEELVEQHRKDDAEKLHGHKAGEYVGDFVYGGIDGVVTTLAAVAGAAGADLSAGVIVVIGLANLFADGFAMGVGNYLSIRAEKERYAKTKREEEYEIETIPELEREEIKKIYRDKGLSGETLDEVVATITADKERWVREMLFEEHGLAPDTKSPLKGGGVTWGAFVIIGFTPLISYLLAYAFPAIEEYSLVVSLGFAAAALFFIGAMKTLVVHRPVIRSGLETLAMGSLAAGVAYFIGYLLRGLA